MYDKNNIFAKIIRKETNAEVIYEDEYIIAIKDKYPIAPIHVLVLPKGEYVDYEDFIEYSSSKEISYFFSKVPYVANLSGAKDYKLVCNKGKNAGQKIFHFHMHIIGGEILKEI